MRRIVGVLLFMTLGLLGATASDLYLKELKAYLSSKPFALKGAMYTYDFDGDGYIGYNEWIYESLQSGKTYRLLGTEPSENNAFGFYEVDVDLKGLVPLGYFAFINFDMDEDKRFSWIYLSSDGKVAKLMGVNATGFFDYLYVDGSAYIPDLCYSIENGEVFIVYEYKDFPYILGSYDTPGFSWALDVQGDIAYVADGSMGIFAIDTSHKTRPTPLLHIDTFHALDVAVDQKDGYGVVADERSVRYLNLKDGCVAQTIAFGDTMVTKVALDREANIAYVGTFDDGVYYYEAAPRKLKPLGHLDIEGEISDLAVVDGKLYALSATQGVLIYDMSDPKHPRYERCITLQKAQAFAVARDVIYVSFENSKDIVAIDKGSWEQNRFEAKEIVTRPVVDEDGSKLYLLNKVASISVYTLDDPLNPCEADTIYLPYPATDMEVVDGCGYVTMGGDGFKIVELQ